MAAAQERDGGSFRDRERERRRQEFLDAAWSVVAAEGLEGLTMQRVSAIVGSAEGTIYNYFATKDQLLSDMQEGSLAVVGSSVLSALQGLRSKAPGDTDPKVLALAALLVGARVWVDAEVLHPREVELNRRIFTHTTDVFTPETGRTVAEASKALFEFARSLFDDAAAAGALAPGDGFERAAVLLAGTTGIQMAAGLARWDERLSDARRFAHRNVLDLLAAWGAEPHVLAESEALIRTVSE